MYTLRDREHIAVINAALNMGVIPRCGISETAFDFCRAVASSVLSLKSLNTIYVTGLHGPRGEVSRKVSLAQRSFSCSFFRFIFSHLLLFLFAKVSTLLELRRFNSGKHMFHLRRERKSDLFKQVCAQHPSFLQETTGIVKLLRIQLTRTESSNLNLRSRG